MAFVRVEQRSAHLATAIRLTTVSGRNGPVTKATFTAISNAWRGSGDQREEEATAILWTLWGKAADNAAAYLSKGSHVNISGRVQNNNYDKDDGTTVYGMAFTAEQVDYLDSKATSEALRMRQDGAQGQGGDQSHQGQGRTGNGTATGAETSAEGQGAAAEAAAGRTAAKPGAKGSARNRRAAHADAAMAADAVADEDIPF